MIKLYDQDSYIQSFTATVVDRIEDKKGIAVVLDQTAFYPEGGGQPADHGGLGDCSVVDVREKDGVILHYILGEHGPQVGEKVTGTLNWARRFSHMQNHTGEHILSGLLKAHYHLDNVGFHMGSEEITIDVNGELTPEQLTEMERKANHIIWENRPNHILFPTKEALSAMAYRSKKELDGQVRILEVGGVDCCACCGTHTATTGEVGMLKIISATRYKGGMRIGILCGGRLFHYLGTLHQQSQRIGNLLSAKMDKLGDHVEKLKGETLLFKGENERLLAKLVELKAEKYIQQTEHSYLCCYEEGISPVECRLLVTALIAKGVKLAMVYTHKKEGAYAIASQEVDVRPFTKQLNGALSGKGGGSSCLTQGSYQEHGDEIPARFEELLKSLSYLYCEQKI